METYERLICDLGHCLLTKGLNNDFTESGRDLEMGCDVHRGPDTKSLRRARHTALRKMWPDRFSKTFVQKKKKKVNLSSQFFLITLTDLRCGACQ